MDGVVQVCYELRMPHDDEWAPPSPIFSRELRIWALNHYARFGSWPAPVSDHPVPEELGTAGMRARAFYLSTVKPVEDRSTWSEFGLISPPDVSPVPTFAPFRPGPQRVR